jgi:hypothetical protein
MQTFEVDKILDESYNAKGIKIYLIKWVGHDISEATWEPHSNLRTMAPHDLNRFLRNMADRKRYAAARDGNVRAKKSINTASDDIPRQIVHRRKRWHLVYQSRITNIPEQILERIKTSYPNLSQFIAVTLPNKKEVHVYVEFGSVRQSIRLEFFGIGKNNKKVNIPTLMAAIKSNMLICELAANNSSSTSSSKPLSILVDPPTIDIELLCKNRRSHRPPKEANPKSVEQERVEQQKQHPGGSQIIKIKLEKGEDDEDYVKKINDAPEFDEESKYRKAKIETLFKLIETTTLPNKKKKVCK